ncbi:MAG: hypothetical protein ACRDSK_00035 [Actinophytocola sp.]|uniref:hypothetical protein n=1 Tax=Actinophytocola sp. TaxID=1872138 RepID=UPI003D6AAF59
MSSRLSRSLAQQLPIQLELGIPTDLVPIAARAGNDLARQDYLNAAVEAQEIPDFADVLPAATD